MTTVGSGYYRTSYRADRTIFPTDIAKVRIVLVAAFALALPFRASDFTLTIATLGSLAIIGAVGANLLIGVAGQVSLAGAAMLSVGAFGAASSVNSFDAPFAVAVLVGALASLLLGLLLSLPALRLRGLYLAIATLAAHFIVHYAAFEYQSREVGAAGFLLSPPAIGDWVINTPMRWYYVMVGFGALALLCGANLMRTDLGRTIRTLRDHDIAAEMIGIDVPRAKAVVFAISAFLIGFQGALFAYYVRSVQADSFGLLSATDMIAMVVIGGLGTLAGSAYGAMFVTWLPFGVRDLVEALPSWTPGMSFIDENLFAVQSGAVGAVMILFLLFEPLGLAEIWRRVRVYFQTWPFSTSASH